MTKHGANRFLLVYGSQTGQAKAIAEEIAENAPSHGLHADLHSLEMTEKKFWLERETCVVLITSTTGDGEPPDNALKFVRRLKKKTLPSDHLQQINYALLGLGDSNYTNFCNCGKTLDKRLEELGAKRFYPSGWADDATGLEQQVDPWIDGLWSALKKQLETCSKVCEDGASVSAEPSSDQHEQTSRLDSVDQEKHNSKGNPPTLTNGFLSAEETKAEHLSTGIPNTQDSHNVITDPTGGSKDTGDSSGFVPSQSDSLRTTSESYDALTDTPSVINSIDTESAMESLTHSLPPLSQSSLSLPVLPPAYLKIEFLPDVPCDVSKIAPQNGCPCPSARSGVTMATVTSVTRLSRDDAMKKALKFGLDISHCDWKYKPGDSFGVLCPNSTEEVDQLLDRLGMKKVADQTYKLSVIEGTKKRNAGVPSHVPEQGTLRHTLCTCCDIRTAPKKAFLRALVEFCKDAAEKRRMQELCSKQGADHYSRYVREASVTLLDLLQAFPSCCPPVDRLLEHLPRLQPRAYSAASSQLAHPGQVHFVFNVVEFPDEKIGSNPRLGVCTGWLDKITTGIQHQVAEQVDETLQKLTCADNIQLPVYLRSNQAFHLPEDLSVPVIMIGPGTGVAPFIGFLQHREVLAKQCGDGVTPGESWLFYGCRHQDRDYLFRKELEAFVARGTLSCLLTSFSRDAQPEDSPRYVQDNIRLHGNELVDLIQNQQAVIYVCGDAKHMARNVMGALSEIFQKEKGMTARDAETYLMQLRIHRKYLEDVWT